MGKDGIMATKKRKNGEGSWGEKTIKGIKYKRFRSPEGKDFYGKTEKEVKRKYEIWKNSTNINLDLNNEKVTVYDFAKEIWLPYKKKHIKGTTYDGYEYFVEDILGKDYGFDFGNIQLANITEETTQKYIDSWADFLPKSSIKKNKSLLSQILKLAKKKNMIADNYVSEVAIPTEENIKKKTRPPVFLSTEDIILLEREAEKRFSNNVLIYGNNAKIIIFLIHTGLRFGELTALKWKNVDLKNKSIFVIDNMPIKKNRDDKIDKKYVLDYTSTKRKSSERHVPLSDKAIEILEYFKEVYRHNDEDNVFKTRDGNFVSRRNVDRTLKAMLKSSGCKIQNASPHDLRHTFGSELIKNGIDIKVVSELLGHKDIQTTYNIYIHVLSEQKVNAIDIFNNRKS